MQHRSGGLVDLLPFSESIAPDGRLQLEEGFVFNMAGFGQVVPNALQTVDRRRPNIAAGAAALLRAAQAGRLQRQERSPRTCAGVFHCLQHYLEEDERRYSVEHHDEGVPYQYTCACMLGLTAGSSSTSPRASASESCWPDSMGQTPMSSESWPERPRAYWSRTNAESKSSNSFRLSRLGTGLNSASSAARCRYSITTAAPSSPPSAPVARACALPCPPRA